MELFDSDPHFRDLITFYEYFHGDTGRGVGASHQTGWTGLVAALIQEYGVVDLIKQGARPGTAPAPARSARSG